MPFFQIADGDAARLVGVKSPYSALEAPKGARWPRATVRPTQLLDGPGHAWAAKIWASPGVPVKKGGVWVTKTTPDLGVAMDWAATEVDRRRPKAPPAGPHEAPC